jgi:hypothetical protein
MVSIFWVDISLGETVFYALRSKPLTLDSDNGLFNITPSIGNFKFSQPGKSVATAFNGKNTPFQLGMGCF